MIKSTKTIYDKKEASDGKRILVMTYWPRGVKKTRIDEWLPVLGTNKEIIKKWKAGKIEWSELRKEYIKDMSAPEKQALIKGLARRAKKETITLLCACKDENRCHRSILRELITKAMK